MHDTYEESGELRGRFAVVTLVFTAFFVILLGRLFYVQIIRGDEYREAAMTSFTATEALPARRGEIKDRNGVVLARNTPAHRLRIVPERLVKGLVGPIEAIARLIGTESPPIITRGQIKFLTQNLDYSIAKAKRMLGYRPRVDFRDGIIEALDYLTGKPIVRELATS